MINGKIVKITTKITSGLLAIGAIAFSFPTLADEASNPVAEPAPLVVPSGDREDLEGLDAKNYTEWGWGIGGEYGNSSEAENANSGYQVDSDSEQLNSQEDILERHQDWQNTNAGEQPLESSTIPVVTF